MADKDRRLLNNVVTINVKIFNFFGEVNNTACMEVC